MLSQKGCGKVKGPPTRSLGGNDLQRTAFDYSACHDSLAGIERDTFAYPMPGNDLGLSCADHSVNKDTLSRFNDDLLTRFESRSILHAHPLRLPDANELS
jgi:hypothetical protein